MTTLAASMDGTCLSDEYINSSTKLRWRCSEGHEWDAPPGRIKTGHWCPKCADKRKGSYHKLTIEDMRKIAKEHGGECLSTEYINAQTKLKWRCAEGHVFYTKPNHIRSGHWCWECANKLRGPESKYNIEDMRNIARERGGDCLSDEFINVDARLRWRCKEGHEWDAIPYSILKGTWCPYCIGRHRSIEDMNKIAQERNGKCLSTEYISSNTKIKWQCKDGHIWEAVPASIFAGSWCPYCVGRNKTIEDMKEIATKRGGSCLSNQYKGVFEKLQWKCANGHKWKAPPHSIISGAWCPYCSSGIHERLCRRILENIFQKEFPRKKPTWLLNEKGNRMEFDGYCESLKIAFEYHGIQHYERLEHFQRTNKEFLRRQMNDEMKRTLCMENGVALIEVPYQVEKNEMFDYILDQLKVKGINPPSIPVSAYDIDTYDEIYNPEDLQALQGLAEAKGGSLLSDTYWGTKVKLRWRCKEGHEWKASPGNVKQGTWCPICGGSSQGNLQQMKELAQKRGGECISTEYINSKTKLRWRCELGHEWETTPDTIKRGRWCPKCARSNRKPS